MSEMLLMSEQNVKEPGAPLPTCLFKQPGTQDACPGQTPAWAQEKQVSDRRFRLEDECLAPLSRFGGTLRAICLWGSWILWIMRICSVGYEGGLTERTPT